VSLATTWRRCARHHHSRVAPCPAPFLHHDGFHCGYCTPGQGISAVALIKEGEAGADAEIRELMSGNICRGGTYVAVGSDLMQPLRDNVETPDNFVDLERLPLTGIRADATGLRLRSMAHE
jgi:xanthine dehydrogenase iron-sulfur cluster and FAD-binding subunit A